MKRGAERNTLEVRQRDVVLRLDPGRGLGRSVVFEPAIAIGTATPW